MKAIIKVEIFQGAKFHLECGKRFKYKIQTLCVYRTVIVYVVEDYGVSKYAPVIAALLKNPPLVLPH